MKRGISARGNRLLRVEELEILERVSRGETRPRAASAIGTTERTVGRVLAAAGGGLPGVLDGGGARRFGCR